MSIFKLDPAFKDYIWGGTRLRDEYGKSAIMIRSQRAGSFLVIRTVQALWLTVNTRV